MATKRNATAKKTAAPRSYSTPALEKGLDVIELLAHQPAGLTKSQIARELNRTVSEIFRMLLCLERRGYIAQVTEERYSLTLKLFKLVQEHPPTERLIADALPVMHQLAHDTLQSCHLGVLETNRIVILAQVNAPVNQGFYVKLGSTVDLLESSSGYVILSRLDEAQRARVLASWIAETGKTLPKDLDSHLKRIHKAGFEKRASYLVRGIVNISYPILDDRGAAIAALTVPYVQYAEASKSSEVIAQAIHSAATQITLAIGGSTLA